jgi:predicted nucleic acid-binding protein
VALIVLDASVVIAFLDDRHASHEAAVAALEQHADDDLRFPASAYAEALVQPTSAGLADTVRTTLEALVVRIEPIGAAAAEAAAELRGRQTSVRLPDALVLGCAQALGADAVLTSDQAWRTFPGVRVIG